MLQIGDKLPDFKLLGYDEKYHTNYDYADKYALAIVFTCNSSEISKAYSKRLIKLFEQYEEDNLAIVGVCSNDVVQSPIDGLEEIKKTARKLGLYDMRFDFLLDINEQIAKKFGATINPEVFLFNRKRELVYKGAIDDNWANEAGVLRVYLEDAIEASLDGVEVDFPEIPAVGDEIIWKK